MKKFFMIALGVVSLSVASCSGNVTLPNDPSNPIEQLTYQRELVNQRPDWTNKGLWEEDDYLYQVGQSMVFTTEREAKKHAYRDASFRLSEYVTQQMDVEFSEMVVSEASSTDTITQKTATKEVVKSVSKSVVSTIAPHETYVEAKIDGDEEIGYTAFAVVRVSKKAMKNATKTAKEEYSNVVSVDNL